VAIETPREVQVRWVARLMPGLKPLRTENAGRVRMVFERTDVPAVEPYEPGRPSDSPRTPHIAFSTGRSWRDMATAYAKIVDPQLAGAALSTLAGGVTGDRVAIATELLARLHRNVRYTGIEFADASIVPRKPAESLARRYGDCKD